ncbi:MAG: caspase family protein [Isosphaeraceae bacterium]|nr:caspase family protein [Isosphaeraceae bacterium]
MNRPALIDRGTRRNVVLLGGLLALLTASTHEALAQANGRVFALLAIDTDAQVAGVDDDGRAMSAMLARGFGSSRLLNMRVLVGPQVRPDVIVNTIRGLPVGPNDTILFYYSGHGATFEGRGHVLTTSHGNLMRDKLRAEMTARRARLNVILTDCCSSLVKSQPPAPGMGAPPAVPEVSPMLRSLLLQHRGTVDLTSSSFGEPSWGRQGLGGIFTSVLTQVMGAWEIEPFDKDKDGLVSWTEVFELVRQGTQQAFRDFKQDFLRQDKRGLDRGAAEQLERQLDQVPQAFALGDAFGKVVPQQDLFAPNLGIHFRMVPVGTASGAQLTQDPVAGSGAAQLGLEPGDTIYNLDGLPIREAVDVMNHHGRTNVSFINVRTNQRQAGVMTLPPATPLPADVPPENYAANLGIHYQLIPYEGDTLGARLSRSAAGNTPAAGLQLERGDMIVRLDGQPIRRPEDVLGHVGRTTLEFVNIRTGKVEERVVQLPAQVVR